MKNKGNDWCNFRIGIQCYCKLVQDNRLIRAMSVLAHSTVLGVLTLSLASFVIVAPAHANDNIIELSVGSDAELKPLPTDPHLYQATTPVTVYDKTADLRGFNLTIHADSADLVNNLDNSRRIAGTTAFKDQGSGREVLMGMNYNSWGYRLEEGHDTEFMPNGFMHPPAGSEPPSVIVDTASEYDNAGCKGKKKCEVHMTFGAAINPTSLATGKYSATVTYTVTAKPALKPPVVAPTVCRSGDPKNDCQVDLDKNLIPVKYTGNPDRAEWTTIAAPEDTTNPGNWYDYGKKQWANAVTIKPDKLAKYQGKTTTLDEQDVLGYYTYVPRYAYEVMRRDGTDKPVDPENFNIVFETANTPKKHPAKCTTGTNHDYRTACNLDRSYPTTTRTLNSTTWSTHPAFTFGTKELNGIWVGKFETTGTPTNPTILPNQRHLSGYDKGVDKKLGRFYTIAKSLGVEDPANTYGDQAGVVVTQNSHHLDAFSSRMPTNSDWGAIAYLSASRYGAGHDNVQINMQYQNRTLDGRSSVGTTGCGPSVSGNEVTIYKDGGTLGTQSACSTSNLQRAYNGSLGQLVSATNNPTGIYDLVGGGAEYVSAARTTDNISGQTTKHFNTNTPRPPYANLYYNTDKDSFNSCTYESCGGQALYETNNGQENDSQAKHASNWQWHDQSAGFASSGYPWFERGGRTDWSSNNGVFFANAYNGYVFNYVSLRIVLAPVK